MSWFWPAICFTSGLKSRLPLAASWYTVAWPDLHQISSVNSARSAEKAVALVYDGQVFHPQRFEQAHGAFPHLVIGTAVDHHRVALVGLYELGGIGGRDHKGNPGPGDYILWRAGVAPEQ